MKLKFYKSNLFKLIFILTIFRVVLFSLYDFKVSQCPDSWSFNHFAQQITTKVSEFSSVLFSDDTSSNATYNDLIEKVTSSKTKGFSGERSPGYPLLMAFFGSSMFLTVLFQFLIGIITGVLWYKTMFKLQLRSKVSFIVTLLLQSYLTLFIYETFILVETLVLFLITIGFYILSDGYLDQKKSFKFELFFGLLLAFLVLVKPFYIIIPCLIFGFQFLNKLDLRPFIRSRVLILILPLMTYLGWSYVVEKYTGYFVSTSYFGLNKAQNCVYFAEKGPKEFNWIIEPYVKHREIAIKENKDVAMSIWYAINAGEFKKYNLSFPELSNELGKFSHATIQNNFADYVHQVATKSWFDFWKSFDARYDFNFKNQTVDATFSNVYTIQNALVTLMKFMFLLVSLYYLYLYLRYRKTSFELYVSLIIWAVSILQGLVTYGENARFSFPFEYVMAIVIVLFIKEIKNRNAISSTTLNS